jgi:hypothetical protein
LLETCEEEEEEEGVHAMYNNLFLSFVISLDAYLIPRKISSQKIDLMKKI